MDESEKSWRNEVNEKLIEVFKGNLDDLCRILFFLDEEDKAYIDNVARPYAPHWESLKATVNRDEFFKMYAKRLSAETRRAENDPGYRKRLNVFYEEMLSYSESSVPLTDHQGSDPNQLLRCDSPSVSAFGGLARAWNIISAPAKESLVNYMRAMGNKTLMTAVDDFVRQFGNKASGTEVMVGLAVVYLTIDALYNIKRWWLGEISGKRCIKIVLDSAFTILAGMGGGFSGAALGTTLGPAGTFVGGVVGGWISAASAGWLSDWLTQKCFGLPKEEALENAYRYLGVDMTASNAKVNTAFRKLCLKHHPDKGGNKDDFFILQCNMSIIRLARGEP